MNSNLAVVLISTDDHAKFISPCLKSLKESCSDLDLKIVFVDNDGYGLSTIAAKSWQDSLPITFINQKNIKGFAENFNDALRIICEPFILLLNVDTLVPENTIQSGINILNEKPYLGALTVRFLGKDKKLQSSARCFPLPNKLFWEQIGISRIFPKSKYFGSTRLYFSIKNELTCVDWISGAFMLMKRQAVIDVGGMDEQYFLYSEDTDFCIRLKQKGWTSAINPQNYIFHHKDPVGQKRRKENFILTNRNILLFLKKHYSSRILLRGRLVLFVGMVIRLVLTPILLRKGKVFTLDSLKSNLIVIKIIVTGNLDVKHYISKSD